MGVLKNLQNLSDLEFYKCAEKLQDDITDFCLRNFGLKKSPRNVNQIIKDISEEDQSEINKIFEKYGKTPNQQYASEYPEWFIDNRKRRLLSYTDDLIDFIIEANTIYPTTLRECDDRRKLRKLRGRLEAGKITAAEIKEQYKSWRGNIIKYKAYKSVRSCDVLYKSLYGGTYGKEENGKRRG